MTLRAVLTGINLYQHYPQDTLRGCDNDANHLAAQFTCDRIVLLDSQATKANELAAWREVLGKSQPGDRVLCAHSSHGIEEGLCSYDINENEQGWDPATYITYYEIADLCNGVPESILVEILIDACHCTNQLRQLGMTYGRAKYLRSRMLGHSLATPAQVARPYAIKPNVILWAACEPTQTSADAYIDNEPQGAFTAAFLKNYRPERCRSDIIFYARQWLGEQGYAQRPHLYAWYDQAMGVM